MPVRLGPFYLVRPLLSILSFYFLLSSGKHDGLRLLRSKSIFSPASDATIRSRMKPRGRDRVSNKRERLSQTFGVQRLTDRAHDSSNFKYLDLTPWPRAT